MFIIDFMDCEMILRSENGVIILIFHKKIKLEFNEIE